MIASYLPDQMLRNLEPQRLTEAQQRQADEQLGATVAAITRRTGRVARCMQAWARQAAVLRRAAANFRKLADDGTSPRPGSACR
jgi:hypothetical protein